MLHLPSTALYSRVYIYIPIGLYLFERLLRTLRYTYNNIRPGKATLIHLPGGVTKIVVSMRQVKSWTPGSFVLLSLPRFGLGQSHPATIASVPSSHEGKLIFFLKAHHGFTSRVHANASVVSLQEGSPGLPPQSRYSKTMHLALIDGPYGGKQLDIAAYNSVLLIAGSTGVSFTLPILLDLAFRAQKQKLPVREVTFIWAIKTSACTAWISDELRCAGDELRKAGIDLKVRVFVTADEEFVEDSASGGEESRDYSTKTCHCKVECACISNSPQIAPSTEPKILQPREEFETQSLSKVALDEKSKDQPPSYGRRGERLTIKTGRPDLRKVVMDCQGKRNRGEELGVAVCGPIGLTSETRRVVARLEGKGAGIYLHAESFGW
jgi:ferric-chelate reductase